MPSIFTGTTTVNRYAFATKMGVSNDAWLFYADFAVHVINSEDGVIVEALERAASYELGFSCIQMTWGDAMGFADEKDLEHKLKVVAPPAPLLGAVVPLEADNYEEYSVGYGQAPAPVAIRIEMGPVTVHLDFSSERIILDMTGLEGAVPVRVEHLPPEA